MQCSSPGGQQLVKNVTGQLPRPADRRRRADRLAAGLVGWLAFGLVVGLAVGLADPVLVLYDSKAKDHRGTLLEMSEPAPTPIEVPPLPPERQAEIRELLARIEEGDLSGTIAWEEVAAELGL
jgi:hypothetical protein